MTLNNTHLTPTKDGLFFDEEQKRVEGTDPVYFVYNNAIFTGAHTSQKTIDLTDDTMVFECHKAKKMSHRIF